MKWNLSIVVALLGQPLASAAVAPLCNPSDPAFICGLQNTEDLVRLRGQPWVVASQINIEIGPKGPKSAGVGPLVAIRTDTHRIIALFPTMESTIDWDRKAFPDCSRPPRPFSAIGLNVRPISHGQYRIYVANWGERNSVEIVDVAAHGERLRAVWRGCVSVPEQLDIVPNGVASLPDGAIVLTGKHVAIWRREEGWRKLDRFHELDFNPKTSSPSGANGGEVSPDGRWLLIADSARQAVVRMPASGDGERAEIKLNFLPDNLRYGEDGRLYVAGPYIAGTESLRRAKECLKVPVCTTGFAIARIDPETLTARELFRTGEEGYRDVFGNSSTALQIGKEIWVGTARGDRVLILSF